MNLINRDTYWIVAFEKGSEQFFENFLTVDAACDYMVDVLGAEDNEVDLALINMTIHNHKRALFFENKFEHTDID